jgi:hypothetical protein
VDEFIYKKLPGPINLIFRWFEFLGGMVLGILIVYYTFVFTGGKLFVITWIIILTLIFLAVVCVIMLLTGKFNAWLGPYAIYAGIYFFYLVVAFLLATTLYAEPGGFPIFIRIVIAFLDLIILLYTIGTLIGERADLIRKKLKFLSTDAILMWLIFCKASYELTIILNPKFTNFKNQWVLFILVALLGIVGLYGIIKYKKHRKKRK